jgi:hypothetical protein
MKIKVNDTTYVATRSQSVSQWTLKTPKIIIDKETKETKDGVILSYHMTLGQCLAIIADKEMGKADDIQDVTDIVNSLREQLLSIS